MVSMRRGNSRGIISGKADGGMGNVFSQFQYAKGFALWNNPAVWDETYGMYLDLKGDLSNGKSSNTT